jgi:hypothetical protein
MATTTRIPGGTIAGQGQSGLEQLRGLDRQQARNLLARLGSDLNAKTGVVRLLHTSKVDKEMKFQTAGGFKQMFLNGGKLQRSGGVILDLLTRAEADGEQVKAFRQYLSQRGRSGAEAVRVLEQIKSLGVAIPQSAVDATPDKAMAKLGMSFKPGAELGEGANGKIFALKHGGQDYVVKEPLNLNDASWQLRLQLKSSQPPPIEQEAVFVRHPSTESVESDWARYELAHAIRIKPLIGESISSQPQVQDHAGKPEPNPGDPVSASDGRQHSMASVGDDEDDFLANALRPGVEWGDDSRSSSEVSSRDDAEPVLKQQSLVMQQPLLVVEPPPSQSTAVHPSPNTRLSESTYKAPAPPLIQELGIQAEKPPAELELVRLGLSVAARVKGDGSGLITPTAYVIRENLSNGKAQYHAVMGGAQLKVWARLQDASSHFQVVRMVMPKAAGKSPLVFPKHKPLKPDVNVDALEPIQKSEPVAPKPPEVNVRIEDLVPMAQQGLQTLKSLSERGFIHGDIKPENMLWDSENQSLRIIDTDGMQKVSKRADRPQPEGAGDAGTPGYVHPLFWKKGQLGVGRDLYAFGLSLLECSVHARGDDKAITRLDDFRRWMMRNVGDVYDGYWDKKDMDTRIMSAGDPNSPLESFAMKAIQVAVNHEFDRKNAGRDRWTPDNNQHPLNTLSQHPLITGA